MPVRLCFRSGVGLSQGLSRCHLRLEQIVRFSRLTRSPNFETCFITPSSYNQASLEFWAHFGPKRSQLAGPKHSPVVLLFLEWKIMHGQGFSSYLNVFCLFVFCVATRGAALKPFLLVYLFVLRQGISHLKFINSDKINEAFLRFMTFAYRLQWITNDVLQKPNLESDVILQRMRFTCKCGRRVKKNIQTHVF